MQGSVLSSDFFKAKQGVIMMVICTYIVAFAKDLKASLKA